ncbi:MATE family efflux transporter [uncultured Chitinophaga sp.]|jgi:Na+-driven multidrug efflux pump|uniref:MATE family efflux transporter n=1 Tax=uncultured Chitinophaga sp. TaxID=339340 RepID=UPI0026118B58|nr:MATE family efflux transporter [uncultured Chitinophaga sp.]
MQAASRVVLNTGALYGRMLITIFISLYSTRLVLNALGAQDYGIFNLVGGVIAMLSFLNMAMTISTQRYMSYHLGSGDIEKLKEVFNSSVMLHFIMGITLVVLFEVVGIYAFDHVLNMPADRIATAKTIFHFMVVSTFFTIASVPYDATLIARENMPLIAVLGVFEGLSKLAIAISLHYVSGDKLVAYGALMASLTVLLLLIKRLYCSFKYAESKVRVRKYFNKSLLKEMFSYAGWNMFGASSVVARNQAQAMILNVFFGTVINAAYGIANQVNAQLTYFSVTMLQSLNPQIIKSEGSGDRPRMLRLAMIASKFSFLLLSFFAIPVIIEAPFILKMWLKNVPEYTVVLCRLIIVCSLVNQLTQGVQVAIQSVGRIKVYQMVVSFLVILNLPVAYLLLRAGAPPQAVLIGAICMEVIAVGYRIIAANRIAGMPVPEYLNKVVLRAVIPVVLAAAIALLPQFVLDEGFVRFLLTGCLGVCALTVFVKFLGLTPYEISKITDMLTKLVSKVSPRFAARFAVIKTQA